MLRDKNRRDRWGEWQELGWITRSSRGSVDLLVVCLTYVLYPTYYTIQVCVEESLSNLHTVCTSHGGHEIYQILIQA